MWPFKRRRDEAKLRAEATRRIADEVADELVKNPRPPRIGLNPAQVRFILLQVRDDPVERAAANIAKAIDLIEQRDGMVTDVMSSVVLAVFGLPESDDVERPRDQQAKTVARLVAELGPEVRLVHGATEGLVGTFGSPQHMHYGPLLPGFARYMTALTALEFGQSAEVRPT
jgi:hypothetical protein